LLYHGLEDWRVKQINKMRDDGMQGDEKNKFIKELMNTEASLIQKIDALKVKAGKKNHEANMQAQIENVSLLTIM